MVLRQYLCRTYYQISTKHNALDYALTLEDLRGGGHFDPPPMIFLGGIFIADLRFPRKLVAVRISKTHILA